MPYTVMMVAAAGGSTRMGQPKQHIVLGEHPVLIHILLTLQAVEAVDEILLIAREEDIPHFTALAAKVGVTKLHTAVTGGSTRQQSVAAGLAALPTSATLVGVHDGARPLVRPEDVAAVIAAAEQSGAAGSESPNLNAIPTRLTAVIVITAASEKSARRSSLARILLRPFAVISARVCVPLSHSVIVRSTPATAAARIGKRSSYLFLKNSLKIKLIFSWFSP